MHPADSQGQTTRETFARAFDPRSNAFNFLRLLLAVLVIVGHCFPLGGFGPEQPVPALTGGRHSLGGLAVGLFFLLSGFLITRSASGQLSVGRFLWHRFLRIFPGYWTCLLVTAFVFAPIFCAIEYGTLLEVFWVPANSPQAYVADNAAMFHPRGIRMKSVMAVSSSHITGLLGHNPSPWTINGSLWTLPIELLCYAAVAVLAAFGVMQRRKIVVLGLFALLLGLYEFNCLNPEAFRLRFPFFAFDVLLNFLFYFFAGSVCFLYREAIPYSRRLFLGSIFLAGLSLLFAPLAWLVPFALPYAFLCLGFKLPVGRLNTRGDFSYGTYIYAFPVQQGLALVGGHKAGFALYLIASLILTALLAVLSYRYVEAPCLRWKNWDPAATFQSWLGTPSPVALATAPAETQR